MTVTEPVPAPPTVGDALSSTPGPSTVRLCGNCPALCTVKVYVPAVKVLLGNWMENSFSVTVTAVAGLDPELPPADAAGAEAAELAAAVGAAALLVVAPPPVLLLEQPAVSSATGITAPAQAAL